MKMAHESRNERLPTVRNGLTRTVMTLSMVSKPVLGSKITVIVLLRQVSEPSEPVMHLTFGPSPE